MPVNPNDPNVPVDSSLSHPRSRRFTLLVFVILIFSGGFFLGRYILPAVEFDYDDPRQYISLAAGERQLVFPTFWKTWDRLHNTYIGQLDDKALFYGAVAGMVRAAGDPYTVYSPPVATKQFEETINGSFSGVGIEIGIRSGVVTVISPLDGSPAEQAGIREGDIIIKVDQEAVTSETTIDEVVQRIRGPRGEAVLLTIFRSDAPEPLEISVIRDTIAIESVKLDINEEGIAHLEITNFNGDTAARFNEAAKQMVRDGAQVIILDVRNNPGGFLEASVDIASRFVAKGELVVSEKGRDNIGTEYQARGGATLSNIPVVVIVNGGSASASEILAGALHDILATPIIGTQTFGKGSVQEFTKLDDDSSLRVTVARWFTPHGVSIDEGGITPTIIVEQDYDTEADEPLERAYEEARKLK